MDISAETIGIPLLISISYLHCVSRRRRNFRSSKRSASVLEKEFLKRGLSLQVFRLLRRFPSLSPNAKRFKSNRLWIPLLRSKSKDPTLWEEVLIQSDMGPRLTQELLQQMKDSPSEPEIFLKERLRSKIATADREVWPWQNQKPGLFFWWSKWSRKNNDYREARKIL